MTKPMDRAYGQMVAFILEKPVKRNFIKLWLDWWDERKQNVFNGFRTLPFVPTTNLSECLPFVMGNYQCVQADLG